MTSLFTVSNIYFSIYYIPTSQLLITILLVWEEGGLVGGGTQQYDGVLEHVYSPAPNAATNSPFSLIHLGKRAHYWACSNNYKLKYIGVHYAQTFILDSVIRNSNSILVLLQKLYTHKYCEVCWRTNE